MPEVLEQPDVAEVRACGHGCGFLSLLARLREEPTPVVYLHRGPDATALKALAACMPVPQPG